LRTRAIPERFSGVFTTRCYTNPRLPLPLPLYVVEVLPLVEFFVEEDIDDKEAVSLLELEPVKKDRDKIKETKSGSKFTFLSSYEMRVFWMSIITVV